MGNPNLNMYQSIDDKAVEHLYDEIKQKEKEAGKMKVLISYILCSFETLVT